MKDEFVYLRELTANGTFNLSIKAMYKDMGDSATTINFPLTLNGKTKFLWGLKTRGTFSVTIIYECLNSQYLSHYFGLLEKCGFNADFVLCFTTNFSDANPHHCTSALIFSSMLDRRFLNRKLHSPFLLYAKCLIDANVLFANNLFWYERVFICYCCCCLV